MYIAIRKRLTSTLAQVPLSGTIFFSTHKKTDMYGISQQKGIQIQHFRQQTNPPPSPVVQWYLRFLLFFESRECLSCFLFLRAASSRRISSTSS